MTNPSEQDKALASDICLSLFGYMSTADKRERVAKLIAQQRKERR